ncbi:hypothetical protein FGE12_26235 [Aggregicoccus sp. 17bor-14]|uniref:hypothetical protein n=1 Tax=Myxococcaceae TaxID=31 RepID=UPI00129C7B07|nr:MULTISPECIES: hypothetical protein [Myxococcaceae]MBF5045938.1 hypothetical protein [Simulacricoccus sp. 17bor-14]MRI91670.1 hypothetical protein [Aggregicoccus sp. 17bor-14]
MRPVDARGAEVVVLVLHEDDTYRRAVVQLLYEEGFHAEGVSTLLAAALRMRALRHQALRAVLLMEREVHGRPVNEAVRFLQAMQPEALRSTALVLGAAPGQALGDVADAHVLQMPYTPDQLMALLRQLVHG